MEGSLKDSSGKSLTMIFSTASSKPLNDPSTLNEILWDILVPFSSVTGKGTESGVE
jgi:hypothetical protein